MPAHGQTAIEIILHRMTEECKKSGGENQKQVANRAGIFGAGDPPKGRDAKMPSCARALDGKRS